jgi:hypothetical protein
MRNKLAIRVLTLSSVALFITAPVLAAVPTNPILGLNGHTATNAYDSGTGYGVYGLSYGIDGGGATFNANGDLTGLADRATCGATNATCKILDGSGDGMLMYLVTDGSGKKHIDQIVGQNDNVNGLFLGELFVEYNGGGALAGGVNIDSMASKYVMKDVAELASAGSGFRLSAEWLRGDYQQIQPSSFTAATTAGGGTTRDLDTVIDMNIGGVVTFHADGVTSENGGVNQAGMVVDIQSGTTADNTDADAEVAQAIGVFHTRLQGGNNPYTSTNTNIGNTDYRLGSPTVTLGTSTLAFAANDGVSATYIHQTGFGFSGQSAESQSTDHPELRDFSFLKINKTAGFPSAAIGTFQDPENGVYATTGVLTATSQSGVAEMYEATTAATNAAHPTDFTANVATTGANDAATAGAGGEFTATSALINAWNTVFGSAPE